MRRPFFWPALGLAAGTLLGKFLPGPTPFLFTFVIFLIPFLWVSRGRRFFLPLFLLAISSIGVLRMQHTLQFPTHHIAFFARGDWVSLEGKVVSFPESRQKGKRRIDSFILQTENFFREGKFFKTTGKVQVFLFRSGSGVDKTSPLPAYGSRVRLRGKLSLPKEPHNPGEFNYRDYLAKQGIRAVFEGYGPNSLRILAGPKTVVDRAARQLENFRKYLSARLDRLFSLPANALLKALILGLRKDLPEVLREDFIKTGTAHLIAISGMNITLVAGTLFLILIGLGIPQKLAAIFGLVSTATYVFISGAGIPVVRAGWMAGLFFAGLLIEREKDLLNALFFAFFTILVFDPNALFQAGFQLSFLSVFFLVRLFGGKEWREGADFFQTGIVLVGTFPLCAVYFSVFSWTSLFANLLAVPFFHLGVMAGMASLLFANLPLLGPLTIWASSFFLKAGLAWIDFWADWSWGYFYLKTPPLSLIIFYYASLALIFLTFRKTLPFFLLSPQREKGEGRGHFLCFWREKGKGQGISWLKTAAVSIWLLATTLFFIPERREHFSLTLLSMGQNEVFHVEFPGGNHWLVNTGRGRPSDQAKWILTPMLRKKGIKQIQGIFLTDFRLRHRGGLETLLENFSVKSILFPGMAKSTLLPIQKLKRIQKRPLYKGDRVAVSGEAGFEVIDVIEGNVFLMIYYGGKKFLFIPTTKSSVLKKSLPGLQGLSFVDVLILPALGNLPQQEIRQIVSLLLPDRVIFPGKPVWGSILEALDKEEIPRFFLLETGALRFEVRQGRLSLTPFHSLLSSRN